MSTTPTAVYSFLSWARQGLGIHLKAAAPGELRGSVDVGVTLRGKKVDGSGDVTEHISRPVQLYGPGDIVGIDPRAMFRTEPRHWITNFESNYLPFVEFYDEDFCWRYTPAAPSPDKKRLTPWLTLIVLEETEFEEGGNILNRPLSFIKVTNASTKFPPNDQLWAWAHVHVNGSMGGDKNDAAGLAQRLHQTVTANRDQAFARLLSPRELKANTGYHAFVMPTFETGRLAGLGLDPAAAGSASKVAWEDPAAVEFPFYHRWYFRTGSVGDFEYLVRLLVPQPVDAKVGQRDMDVQAPGSGLPAIDKLDGLLRLGGALRAPKPLQDPGKAEWEKWEFWASPFPQPFQTELAKFLNLPDSLANDGSDEDDPLIAPPIYGRWHAGITRLDPASPQGENWIHELNLDPRFRTPAGFGTNVVQKYQEDYMEAAWKQVGKVLAGNQKIRYAQMALAASKVWQDKHLEPMMRAAPERYLMLAAPVQRRVLAEGLTVHQRFVEGVVPPAMLSKVSRQMLRPRGRIARHVGLDAGRTLHNLLGRLNSGDVVVAPPKTVSPSLPTGDRIADKIRPHDIPDRILDAIRQQPLLRWLPLIIAIVLVILVLLLGFGLGAFLLAIALAVAVYIIDQRIMSALVGAAAADSVRPGALTPDRIDALPTSSDFSIGNTTTAPTLGGPDSQDAIRFKEALRNTTLIDQGEAALPKIVRKPLDLLAIASTTVTALQPNRTIPAWTLLHVAIPSRIRQKMVEDFGEVMVYPEIDLPTYWPLKEISSELFVPNLHLIPVNSITLLETNQKFIESYMVGLNHEFSRELLWREYPTDQRGSYFRQFWDPRGFLSQARTEQQKEQLRERLRDIPELHRWSLSEELGDHDHREAQGDKEEEIVLVIRGELLKKYPTAVIYAHRADWERNPDGSPNKAKPRKLKVLTPAEEADPSRDVVKPPLYEAKVDPDLYFFGFDLTAPIAKGTDTDPGWFFVIKERPGEPRFGLDLPKAAPSPALHTWNELAWSDVTKQGEFLTAGQPLRTLSNPGPGDNQIQFQDDQAFQWRPDTHAAELAYILYQVPVLMAVHAAEMLPKEST